MKYLKSFKRHSLIAAFVAFSLPMQRALALEVAVTGLRNTNGDVVVCVWRQEDNGFPNCGTGQPFKKQNVPAIAPKLRLTICRQELTRFRCFMTRSGSANPRRTSSARQSPVSGSPTIQSSA